MVGVMKRSTSAVAGLIAAVLLAACNNNNNGGIIGPTPGANCPNPPYQLEVLYPKPNAGKAPPTTQVFYVAFNQALPNGNQYDFISQQSNGSNQFSVNTNGQPVNGAGSGFYTVNSSQIPFPHANPTYANAHYYATAVPYPIGPLQTVNLIWNDYGTQCNPTNIVSSFTTK